jgi:hypothetical protein
VNEVSFHTRPHHNVHNTLGVDTEATGPQWRVDFFFAIQGHPSEKQQTVTLCGTESDSEPSWKLIEVHCHKFWKFTIGLHWNKLPLFAGK